MRSLSFLLVTYYAVLNLFVTQIVLDVPLPFPLHPFALGARAIKNCAVGETHGKMVLRQNEGQREKLLIKRQRLNDGETNPSSFCIHTQFF